MVPAKGLVHDQPASFLELGEEIFIILLDLETEGITEARNLVQVCIHPVHIVIKHFLVAVLDEPFGQGLHLRRPNVLEADLDHLEKVVLNHAVRGLAKEKCLH